MGDRPSLKTELLVNLGLLTAAALTLAISTAVVVQVLETRLAVAALLLLIAADVFVVFLYGRHLVERLVLRPMDRLITAVDALAQGDFTRRAPASESREFTQLADHFNAMTDRILDVQGQLIRAEKMATVGHLAAGVAHEVGNPLSAVRTYLDVLAQRGADPSLLQCLQGEVGRIDRIVRGLLDYARPRDDELGPVNLQAVVQVVRELLEHQGVLKHVSVRVELDAAPLLVRGRAHALEQVVVNLLLNALDASPRGPVVVGATPWRFEPRPGATPRRRDPARDPTAHLARRDSSMVRRPWRPELEPGTPGVLLYVADAGSGIPVADREKIFDPFYTTKPPGKGTGLGLAVVQRTVHELGGVVWVDDAREGGATFKVFLPAAEAVSA